jgi:hypothetical protein
MNYKCGRGLDTHVLWVVFFLLVQCAWLIFAVYVKLKRLVDVTVDVTLRHVAGLWCVVSGPKKAIQF